MSRSLVRAFVPALAAVTLTAGLSWAQSAPAPGPAGPSNAGQTEDEGPSRGFTLFPGAQKAAPAAAAAKPATRPTPSGPAGADGVSGRIEMLSRRVSEARSHGVVGPKTTARLNSQLAEAKADEAKGDHAAAAAALDRVQKRLDSAAKPH